MNNPSSWGGPYHESWPPAQDTWVMWVMPNAVRVGQVLSDFQGTMSLVVQFQGNLLPTYLPDAYQYWEPQLFSEYPQFTLTPVPEPTELIEPPEGPEMTVKQAAARLGTTPKDIRRMLRSGQLQGRQEGGSWVAVIGSSAARLRADESPAMG